MFTFHTEKVIAELSSSGTNSKLLTLTSWNDRPAKLDLRQWRLVGNAGELQPGKGVTLNEEEAQTLVDALTDYLSGLDRAEA